VDIEKNRMTTTHTTVDLLPRRLAPLRKLVVGVDGGGTRTRAAILDGDRVLGEGTSGPSNPLRVGIANGATAIRDAIDKACSAALIDRDDLIAAGIGVAGVRRIGIGDNARPGVQQQPRFGECFLAVSEDSRNPAFHAHEGREYRKLVSPGRHYQSTSREPEYGCYRQEIEETEIPATGPSSILLPDTPQN